MTDIATTMEERVVLLIGEVAELRGRVRRQAKTIHNLEEERDRLQREVGHLRATPNGPNLRYLRRD
jgi:predicted RNase H-like nuclease (RuvC/YqgF family)